MLYTKAIDEITWDDVELFCKEGIEENAYLDYKREFPNNLYKTISAMGNVLGVNNGDVHDFMPFIENCK